MLRLFKKNKQTKHFICHKNMIIDVCGVIESLKMF